MKNTDFTAFLFFSCSVRPSIKLTFPPTNFISYFSSQVNHESYPSDS